MKRTILLVTSLAIVAGTTGAWFMLGHAEGQQTAPAPAATKVGVVNMGILFTKYIKVKTFKDELERNSKPFKDKKEELEKYIVEWKGALTNNGKDPKRKPLTEEQIEQGRRIIIECQRQLEDLEIRFRKEVGKSFEDKMLQLSQEINNTVQTYGASHGYHLILAYGEPDPPLPQMVSFRRRMQVIDQGGITPIYTAAGVDISQNVLNQLNAAYPGPGGLPVRNNGPTGSR